MSREFHERMIGQSISHYRIIDQLGAGGMGEVFLAEDTTLGRRVALKLLPSEYTRHEDRLRRFKQEAKLASALNHPNILTIHEVGEADGRQFIATEFVQGETLRMLLKRAAGMDTSEVLNVAVQVASALSAAHAAGIVHRDIKPENIMVRGDGYVKVLDFGLAKLTEAAAPPPVDSTARTETVALPTGPGVVLGTTQYMSPEQTAGRTVDARSDIFSFGAVLYEMVSGRRAFHGDSAVEVSAAVLRQEPDALPARVPPALATLIARCLRKDPGRRYQTMADLKAALEDLRDESSVAGRRDLTPASRWPAWALWPLVISIAGLAGLLVWQTRRAPQDQPPLRATAFTTLPGVEQAPSLSPDGNYAVFSWTGPRQDNQDIYLQMIGSGSPLPLTTDPLNDYNPVWSPDGRWIAFFRSQPPAPTGVRSRELRLKPPLGGAERKLADIRSQDFPFAVYLAWSADSTSLVVTDSTGDGQPDALFVVSLETGEKTQLTKPLAPALADTSPAVSPDGRSMAFLRRMSWGAGELQVLPLGTGVTAAGEPRRLTPIELRADYPAWMPDGREIVFSSKGNLWRQAASGDSAPVRLLFVGEDGVMPAISRPQPGRPIRLLYVRSFIDDNFWKIGIPSPGAPSPSAPVVAIASTKREYHPEFSPDGSRVAFTSSRSGELEIWLSDPDGSSAVQLTSMGAQDTNCPHWSPDGQLITFSSNAAGEWDIYVVPAAGGKPRRLTSHPAIDLCPTFSRDGKWIYFQSMRSGDYRTWKMPLAGGEPVQVTSDPAAQTMEAPDGSIYHLSPAIESPLWRLSKSGGPPVKILDGVVWFNLCLFGNGAYYIDRIDGEARLQYLDFATGRHSTVARNLGEVGAYLTASPDGRTILYTRMDAFADDLMLIENFR